MSVYFDEKSRTFWLDGKNVTYAFYINEWEYAEHLYYGEKIPHDDLLPLRSKGSVTFPAVPEGKQAIKGSFNCYYHFGTELSFYGTGDYREPTVQVKNPAGDRLSSLLYDGYEILGEKPRCGFSHHRNALSRACTRHDNGESCAQKSKVLSRKE